MWRNGKDNGNYCTEGRSSMESQGDSVSRLIGITGIGFSILAKLGWKYRF